MRLRLFDRFVIVNLDPLSEVQQNAAISMQLEGSDFYSHLRSFSSLRTAHDELYAAAAFPLEADRTFLEQASRR